MRQRANLGKHRYVRQYGCTRLSLPRRLHVGLQPGQRPGGGAGSCYASIPTGRDLRPIGPAAHRDLRPVLHQGSEVIVEHRLELAAPVAPEGAAIDLFSALGSGGAPLSRWSHCLLTSLLVTFCFVNSPSATREWLSRRRLRAHLLAQNPLGVHIF